MNVIGREKLKKFMKKNTQSRTVLPTWEQLVMASNWHTFHQLKATFPGADLAKGFVVFDVRGDKYRVVAEVNYSSQQVLIRHVFNHAEYNTWCATIR